MSGAARWFYKPEKNPVESDDLRWLGWLFMKVPNDGSWSSRDFGAGAEIWEGNEG